MLRNIGLLLIVLGLVTACDQATEGGAPSGGDVWKRATQRPEPKEREVLLASPIFHVDRIFESMAGPVSTAPVSPFAAMKRNLLWLTGFRVEVVDAEDQALELQEFECHTNLSWRAKEPPAWSKRRIRKWTLSTFMRSPILRTTLASMALRKSWPAIKRP